MPTECNAEQLDFGIVEGRAVVAAFDAGAVTSDVGALLLGATDRAIRMMDRLASCFHDVRCPELIEHQVVTLVGQRVGLSISHDIIVKQHGGSIEVDTQPGEFTEFRIVLPRAGASLIKSGERA